MKVFMVSAIIIASFVGSLRAEPLDPKQVSADAKWVVHIDVDAMRNSTVVQKVYAHEMSKWKELEKRADAIRHQLCMDPNKDLHGITAFGPKPGQKDGVLIVEAAIDQQQFIDQVSKAPDYRKSQHGAHTLHAWTQADGPVASAFFGKGMVLLAKTDRDVTAALDVLDGKAASLSEKTSLAASVPAGTILLIRAIGLSAVNLPFQSPLVKQSDSLDIAFGEDKQESFSSATLVTKSAKVAGQVQRIIEGVRTTAELQYGDDPRALNVIQAMKVRIDDHTVHIDTRVSANDVWALIEKVLQPTAGKATK